MLSSLPTSALHDALQGLDDSILSEVYLDVISLLDLELHLIIDLSVF
jgi:hypothetical protein